VPLIEAPVVRSGKQAARQVVFVVCSGGVVARMAGVAGRRVVRGAFRSSAPAASRVVYRSRPRAPSREPSCDSEASQQAAAYRGGAYKCAMLRPVVGVRPRTAPRLLRAEGEPASARSGQVRPNGRYQKVELGARERWR